MPLFARKKAGRMGPPGSFVRRYRVEGRALEAHVPHAAHAAGHGGHRLLVVGPFGDRGFGGDQQAGDRGSVLQRNNAFDWSRRDNGFA